MIKSKVLPYAIAVAVSTTAGLSVAQAASSDDAKASFLEEIIVTARKREESVQTIPIAITAMGSEELREKMINDPYDLGTQISGLSMRAGSGTRNSPNYFMRGQGPTFNAPAAVVTYFADVPSGGGAISGSNIQMFDTESIQVLKGPQGTLFGRSSTGGAVLISPKRAGNELDGFIETTVGNYDAVEITGGITIPIIDDVLSVRFAGTYVDRDGFTKSIDTGEDFDDRGRTSYRIGVHFSPTERITSDFMFQADKTAENGTSTILRGLSPTFALNNPVIAGFAVQGLCAALTGGIPPGFQDCVSARTALLVPMINNAIADVERINSGGDDAVRRSRSAGDSFSYGHEQLFVNTTTFELGELSFLGDVTLKNIFSMRRTLYSTSVRPLSGFPGLHAIPTNGFNISEGLDFTDKKSDGAKTDFGDHITEEFQIQGLIDDRHSWILGYYLERRKQDINPMTFFQLFNNALEPALVPRPLFNFTADTYQKQRGIFGQFTVDLSEILLEGLHFTAGYRKSYNEQSSINLVPVPLANGGYEPGEQVNSSSFKEDAPSWSVSLDYQVNDDMLVYIAHRRGFKPGGVNGTASGSGVEGAVAIYDPEVLDDIEIGIKLDWQLNDIQGRTNVAIYRQWYSDIQRSETLLAPGNQTLTQTNNISEATIKGLEIDSQIALTENLTINLTYTYIDAGYDEYPGTALDALNQPVSLSDSPYPGTPENAGSLGIRYHLPFVDESLGDISLTATYYRQSSVTLDDEAVRDPFDTNVVGSWGKLDLRADWANVAGSSFDAALYVSNATDDVHIIGNASFVSLGYFASIYNEPRTYGLEVRYRFGASAN